MGRRMREPTFRELKKLEEKGYITSAQDFATHMAPEITWIDNADFQAAFAAETRRDDTMRDEAAFTTPGVPMPGYVNMQLNADQTAMQVMVRSQGAEQPSTVEVPLEDFDDLFARAHFIRQGAKPMPAPATDWPDAPLPDSDLPTASEETLAHADNRSDAELVEVEAEFAPVPGEDTAIAHGATAGDPLAQRVAE